MAEPVTKVFDAFQGEFIKIGDKCFSYCGKTNKDVTDTPVVVESVGTDCNCGT